MPRSVFALVIVASLAVPLAVSLAGDPADHDKKCVTESSVPHLPSPAEARGRALVLHETFEAALHALHHHYYREDEGLPIPGVVMKDVFRELADRRGVQLRWLAVDGQAMNVAHLPQDDFERAAVKALAAGDENYDHAENGTYRYAGMICLTSECLKCHVPNRKSTEERSAGILISMPVKAP